MMLAQFEGGNVPTTLGGVAVLALTLIVYNYFSQRKTTERDITKASHLQEQTALLAELVSMKRKQFKKSKRNHRKTHSLLGEVLKNQGNKNP